MRSPMALEQLLHRLESSDVLDRPADLLAGLLRRVIASGPVEDVLSGTSIGHPVHPALVSVPIGAWVSASVLDLVGSDPDAARRLVALGNLSAVPTALTGANDWLTTAGAERRVGLVHALTIYGGLGLQLASSLARRRRRHDLGVRLSLGGSAFVAMGGWLGGHLVFAQGVGVDTTAFQKFPTEWIDAGAASDVPLDAVRHTEVDGIPVLLARLDGALVALADRCTHRGAPLHEGELSGGCISCPWHGSVFALADGAVVSGPATRPQPTFEVDERAGRVFLRRAEERTLRTNPVGR